MFISHNASWKFHDLRCLFSAHCQLARLESPIRSLHFVLQIYLTDQSETRLRNCYFNTIISTCSIPKRCPVEDVYFVYLRHWIIPGSEYSFVFMFQFMIAFLYQIDFIFRSWFTPINCGVCVGTHLRSIIDTRWIKDIPKICQRMIYFRSLLNWSHLQLAVNTFNIDHLDINLLLN